MQRGFFHNYKILILLTFIFITVFMFYNKDQINIKIRDIQIKSIKYKDSNIPIILHWTDLFKSRDLRELFLPNNCRVKCEVTFNKDLLNQSEALIFHPRDIKKNDIPPRLINQIWIFSYLESPANTDDIYQYNSFSFNWTWTYRHDAEIYEPYGQIFKRDKFLDPFNVSTEELKNSLKNKKLAVWRVSNCKTKGKREDYVENLKKFIPIDIYGKCGTFKCNEPKGIKMPRCLTDIASEYKFIFAFENSLCDEYITEKFFEALEKNIVPIVYGGANYSQHAPNGSYINSRDFNSPKELSDYLLYLNSNDEEYLKYFEWKKELKSIPYLKLRQTSASPWCSLCEKVYKMRMTKQNSPDYFKTYDKIADWWVHKPNSDQNACA